MQLTLIRHAAAADPSSETADEARPLTAEGRDRFREIVAGMRRFGLRFDRLYHSPVLRAVETADLCAPLVEGETVVTPLLTRAPGPDLLAALEGDRVALVGHQPWLGETLSLLLLGDRRHGDRFPFKKGGVALLEGEARAGGMRLTAMLPPRALRRMR